MALFWPLENLTRMRKFETNEDGFNSAYLQIPVTWNFALISNGKSSQTNIFA